MEQTKRAKRGNFKLAGSYSSLGSVFTQRRNLVEIDHTPPSESYNLTPYSSISYNNRPAIALLYDDHRRKFTTGHSHDSSAQRGLIHQHLKSGNFANAVLVDLIDTHNVSVDISGYDYRPAMKEFLNYIKNTVIPGAPNGKPLISSKEYNWLLNFVNKLKPRTTYNGSDRIPKL